MILSSLPIRVLAQCLFTLRGSCLCRHSLFHLFRLCSRTFEPLSCFLATLPLSVLTFRLRRPTSHVDRLLPAGIDHCQPLSGVGTLRSVSLRIEFTSAVC